MPSLLEVQHHFARGMLTGSDAAVEGWIAEDDIAAAERIGIYRNTFLGVLVNAMRLTYPVTERLVGAEFFEGAARFFLSDNPPHSACLNDYGAGFDAFLAQLPEAAGLSYLPDVARLEWAVSQAAVAEDSAVLDPAALMQFLAEELGELQLVPVASLRMVDLAAPADAIWLAITADNEDALKHIRFTGEPYALLVHRGEGGIVFRRLSGSEREMTAALCNGSTLATALATSPEAEAMTLLAEHLAAGRFACAERTRAIQ